MNYLFCSVGRRAELINNFRKSAETGSVFVATDNSKYAPALYMADVQYIVPRIDDPTYVEKLLDICRKEHINAITTFIDPEISLLASNRARFEAIGVEVLAPYDKTAQLCFDKYQMYKYLKENEIDTIETWGSLDEFRTMLCDFPVFVKPRTGSGSVGARKINSYEELAIAMNEDPSLIIQEYMECLDLDADVYIDTITHEAVSAFAKKKIETRIGGANKTVSFKDDVLFDFIKRICKVLKFNGPIDMDFFCRDGKYFLSEINPRFGGAYLHAYGAGVDFIKMIENNLHGKKNLPSFGDYDEDIIMMMYDSVVIKRSNELID